MIPTISTLSIVVILLAAMFKSGANRFTLLTFSLISASIYLVDKIITDNYSSYYYLLCALADLLIIHLLARISKPNNTVLLMQQACKLFIYINLFGWLSYELYYEPVAYNILCASLFITIACLSITRNDDGWVGNSSTRSNRTLFFGGDIQCFIKMQDNKATQRP